MADTDTNTATDNGANSDNAATKTDATAKPTPVYTKDDLTRITQREVAKYAQERDALKAKLDEIEAEKEQERVAKLSAAQRAEEERKRAEKATAEKIAALEGAAAQERTKRHEAMCSHKAASLASQLAAQVWTPDLMPHVETAISRRLVVVDDGKGGEAVMLRMGAEGDNEPLDTGFAKLRETPEFRGFIKINGGSGAQHGGGAGGSQPKPASLVEAIEAEAAKRRNR